MKLNAGHRVDFDELDIVWPGGGFNPLAFPNVVSFADLTDSTFLTKDSAGLTSRVSPLSKRTNQTCLVLPGVLNNTASLDNTSITGNFTLTLNLLSADYTPASDVTLINKLSGNDGFAVYWLTTDKIRLAVGDGASVTNVDVVAASSFADLSKHSVTIIWEDGVGATFQYDGVTSGTQVAAVKTLTNAAVAFTIGSSTSIGNVYSVVLTNSSTTTYYSVDFTIQTKGTVSFTATTGGTVTINTTAISQPARIQGELDLSWNLTAGQPTWLEWSGSNYIYFNGVSGNTVSCPVANDTYDVAILYKDGTSDTSTVVVGAGTATFGGTDAKFSVKGVAKITLTKTAVVVAVCDASDYPAAGGPTFVSSATGETWTINGGAMIVQTSGLYFNGTANLLKSAPFSLVQPENVMIVFKPISFTTLDHIYDGNSTTQRMAVFQVASPDGLRYYAGTNGTARYDLSENTACVSLAAYNGASSVDRINRGAAVTSDWGTSNGGGFTLGARYDNVGNANIFVTAILITDGTPWTTTDMDRLDLWAARKYRIPNV